MNNGSRPRKPLRTVGRMVERSTVPPAAIGVFWLGGPSLAFKTPAHAVLLMDPSCDDGDSPVGAIDVRPDLVFCTHSEPEMLDLSTLAHIATAYPEARFMGSTEARKWMTGHGGIYAWDEVPIAPGRIRAVAPGDRLDVRSQSMPDAPRIHVLEGAGEASQPVNLLLSFSGIRVLLVRHAPDFEAVERLQETISRRVEILIWPLGTPGTVDGAEAVSLLRPRYAVPIGYDTMASGRQAARKFRESVGALEGVKAYLFPEGYLEGLVYARIAARRRGKRGNRPRPKGA